MLKELMEENAKRKKSAKSGRRKDASGRSSLLKRLQEKTGEWHEKKLVVLNLNRKFSMGSRGKERLR